METIAVLGTGVIGHSVALLCAERGFNVKMYGPNTEMLDLGFKGIDGDLDRLLREGKIDEAGRKEIRDRITGVTSVEDVAAGIDFVIECLPEKLDLKQKFYKELDELCPKEVILSSSTSGLSPTAMAETATKHPERIVVAHFWNPPHLVPLVEVVPGEKTSQEVVDKTCEWMEKIDRVPVKMNKECLGFIGNRLQFALLREALYIVEQGWADMEAVDKTVEYSFARRLPVTGPIKSADLGGLDTFSKISNYLFKDLCNYDESFKMLEDLVAQGKFGGKTKEGFYKWDDESLQDIQTKRAKLLNEFLQKDVQYK